MGDGGAVVLREHVRRTVVVVRRREEAGRDVENEKPDGRKERKEREKREEKEEELRAQVSFVTCKTPMRLRFGYARP